MHLRPVFTSAFLFLLACSTALANTEPALPEGLSASDWTQIQQQIQAPRFHAQAGENGGWQATNPAHGFGIDYRPDGQTVLTLSGDHPAEHRIALQLEGYGYGDDLIPLTAAPALSANGNTVAYQWKPGLREWWINNEQGVAQWFELAKRPAMADPGLPDRQPLVMALQLETGMQAHIQDNVLHLRSEDGVTHLTYDRLKVWDSTGRVLPAEMVLNDRRLALRVEDAKAVYPVTIDPTFSQQAYLKASNTGIRDLLGNSIAVSGNTLVVGASNEGSNATGVNGNENSNSAPGSGAAYVFTRNGLDSTSLSESFKHRKRPPVRSIGRDLRRYDRSGCTEREQ